MKKYKNSIVWIMFLLSACANPTVYSDYDKQIDFTDYTTYFICIDDLEVSNVNHPIYDNKFNRIYIKNAITAEMNKIGYVQDEINPDLFVSFRIIINEKQTSVKSCSAVGAYNYWPDCTINTYDYTEGTVVVYISDIKKNQTIWQGTAIGILNIPPAKIKKAIDKTIKQIFQSFPKKEVKKNKDDSYTN